ncbi:MAG: hypothetical protein ABI120_14995 [Gemmatimonadaceae bacterium]
MLSSLVGWLDSVGTAVFWTCLIGLVVVNDVAAMAFFAQRSRELANRWTAPVLAANVLLIGTLAMVPAVTYVARSAAVALAPAAVDRMAGSIELGVPK